LNARGVLAGYPFCKLRKKKIRNCKAANGYHTAEVARVTFPDCDSVPVPKFLNPAPDRVIFQI